MGTRNEEMVVVNDGDDGDGSSDDDGNGEFSTSHLIEQQRQSTCSKHYYL